MAEESRSGKVLKVLTVDGDGESVSKWSAQLPVDPFNGGYQYSGLKEPPYSLEQLVYLAEQHPTHGAALEQKSSDVIGTGWQWESLAEGSEESDEEQRKSLDSWITGLAEDGETDDTSHEILLAAWEDKETVGQGFIELARDPNGKLRHWFSTPGHTFRFHRDGVRIAQKRGGKRRWFKRWIPGDKRGVNLKTGKLVDDAKSIPFKERATELFVLRSPGRRSTWYGIPNYISSVGWITLSVAARDDNLLFFENRREPRWAIIMENVEDDPEVEEAIQRALSTDLKQPHRNLVIPLSGGAKINFQQLGDNKGDMSWEKLQERADKTILTAHRLPGERIGFVRTGALGGSTVEESGIAYKEAVIGNSQAMLSSRINKLIEIESGIDHLKWSWHPTEMDLSTRDEDRRSATQGFTGGVLKLNEAREAFGEEPLDDEDERGEQFVWELDPKVAAAAMSGGGREELGQGEGEGHRAGPGEEAMAAAHGELAEEVRRLVEEPKQ